jgi:hypothetical protein
MVCRSLALTTLAALSFAAAPTESGLKTQLADYQSELAKLRATGRPLREMPAARFFLFGMGSRQKLLYRDGALWELPSGRVVKQWNVASELIVPPAYAVLVHRTDGGGVLLEEDEAGVWLTEDGRRTALSKSQLKLPTFAGRPSANVLRVLHQEILINVVDGKPLPNLLVYATPWYRDGAMVAMVLARTGNLDLLKGWIASLSDPFDHNNRAQGVAESEADNLGQALYLIALGGERNHPLIARILEEAKRFRQEEGGRVWLRGRSDFGVHPVYQTKWMKFGLRALGLRDDYTIPRLADTYSALFWWDYRSEHVAGERFSARLARDYPYLAWAEDHFYGEAHGPVGTIDYPLSWEAQASQANYAGMRLIAQEYAEQKLAAPHTWHAAEMFLYLMDSAPRR